MNLFQYARTGLVSVLLIFSLSSQSSAAVDVKPDHPERYVVVSGDTLWDIAGKFLQQPWLWPEVWHVNPQIGNPHLIYPGDILVLTYLDGKPILRLERGHPTIKLSPQVRVSANRNAIQAIPIDAIQQFLTESRIVSSSELEEAPYVLQVVEERVLAGANDRLYIRGVEGDAIDRYSVFRANEIYRDPDSGEELGQEALFVGDGKLERFGDPATLLLTRTRREAMMGDRLLPTGEDELLQDFVPHAPATAVEGAILSVIDGVSHIGQYQVVVIDLGADVNMEAGHVLAIDRSGKKVMDKVTSDPRDTVQLPDELAGYLMVFRVFDRLSYGLVMDATRAIRLQDVVRTP
jgi:hypothetical protein